MYHREVGSLYLENTIVLFRAALTMKLDSYIAGRTLTARNYCKKGDYYEIIEKPDYKPYWVACSGTCYPAF